MNVTIEITEDDIKRGVTKDCKACPIARAFCRVLRSGFYPDVTVPNMRIFNYMGRQVATITLPIIAIRFIEDFDFPKDRPVIPFKFVIQLEDKPELLNMFKIN